MKQRKRVDPKMKFIALLIVVVSGVLYQICSKSIPDNVNPFIPLLCTYGVALLTAVILCIITGGFSHFMEDVKHINIFSLILGAVICFYELGFILAYRNGFSLTTLPPLANILVIVAVCIVGVVLYGEQLSLLHISGLLLAVSGVALTML